MRYPHLIKLSGAILSFRYFIGSVANIQNPAGELIQDPAIGFLIAADSYIKGNTDGLYDLDEKRP
jgi:type I restriction enzyme M protein